MIPFLMTLRLRRRQGRTWRLWIPLFLVWILLLPIVLLVFPVMLVMGLCVGVNAFRVCVWTVQVVCSLRNLVVDVEDEELSFGLRFV